jgi:histidine ammonia-lyase
MAVTIERRSDLTLAHFERVVWQGERLEAGASIEAAVTGMREAFLRYCARPGTTVYGVTSGYGTNARRRMSEEEAQAFHAKSLAAGAMSFGEPLALRAVRGILFARLANLVEGHGATSFGVVQAVIEMLNGERIVPPVPRQGTGCAGEILPLYHLFAPLSDAFRMEIKEKGPLSNGAPCAAALIADAALSARRRLDLALEIFALSIEAMRAPLEAYDPVLAELWNDADAGFVLKRLQTLLAGAGGERRSFQAPVSWRILPRVLGRATRTQRRAAETAEAILPAVTDNPVFLPPDASHPDGRSFSTGGYHDSHAVPALDDLAAAAADLCLIAERHVGKLLDGAASGLPDKLARPGPSIAGGAVALAYAPMASVGFLEEARQAATTTLFAGAEGGAFGQDDVTSPVFPAWEKQEAAGLALERSLAILAAVASQALFVTDRAPLPALAERLAGIRAAFAPVDDIAPRILGNDAARLAAAFRTEIYGKAEAGAPIIRA